MSFVLRRRFGLVASATGLSMLLAAPPKAAAQDVATTRSSDAAAPQREEREREKRWYERIGIRGYTQIRYNRIGATNPHLVNHQGDKSIGDSGGLYIRRARLVFSGDLNRYVWLYFQPDFASAIGDGLNAVTIRDAYADVFLDRDRRFRFRVGQSKVPYGWELMQSSSNRLPLDRSDGINSAFVNERDLGVFFYFETPDVRRRFRRLVDSGLKGSGDFGMTAFGVSNGQPLNSRERNDNKHFFTRVAYPFDVGAQTLELAAAAYSGLYVPSRTDGIGGRREIQDMRAVGTFVLYPQPFGLQAEYNFGYGPELVGDTIERRPLEGGYVMAMWRQRTKVGVFTPFVRVHHYDGGKKFETNALRHVVRELDAGVEWQVMRWLELTTELMASDRTVNGVRQEGRLLRLQVQFNY
jgi:hypothetical protein